MRHSVISLRRALALTLISEPVADSRRDVAITACLERIIVRQRRRSSTGFRLARVSDGTAYGEKTALCLLAARRASWARLWSARARGASRSATGPSCAVPTATGRLARDRPARQVGAQRRELPVAGAVRRPLGADRHGQPRLRAEPGRPRRRPSGARHVPRRRHRQTRLGVRVQHLPERRAAAPRRLGLAGGRSGDRQRLRAGRRRARSSR